MDMPDTVESGVTDSYRNALRDAMAYDKGMDEIKFAKEHMSARSRSQVDRMAAKLSRKTRHGRPWRYRFEKEIRS